MGRDCEIPRIPIMRHWLKVYSSVTLRPPFYYLEAPSLFTGEEAGRRGTVLLDCSRGTLRHSRRYLPFLWETNVNLSPCYLAGATVFF